ncbi:MAG TPA: type IV pilus twitching motility protein PilT [Gammaproteobacteria bacterium]|nr:type IV pilus twitching motility protein PilT [Gammaproteobacteria bacterium]
MKQLIDKLLRLTIQRAGSDLHLLANEPPRARIYGELTPLQFDKIDPAALEMHLLSQMNDASLEQFNEHDGTDFSYEVKDLARFRVNAFRYLNGVGAVFRIIPTQAITLDDLGLPRVIRALTHYRQGLILVTGKTGSGKTTTLAAMIDEINRSRHGHIITIEDPIEFVHPNKKSLISQREVGQHTPDFATALRSALREDPDVVLVGELRDLETISLAVTAAETGILVLGTLHTNRAATTVDRIINVFPAKKQPQVRAMLSTSLRAVVAQQLVRKQHEHGMAAAVEVLINTPAVANLIREGKTDQLENAMQSGAAMGMQTMDTTLIKMMETTIISSNEAYEKAFRKDLFGHPDA